MLKLDQEFYQQFPEAKQAYLEQWRHPPAFQGIYPKSQPGFERYGENNRLLIASHHPKHVYVPLVLETSTHTAPSPYAPHPVQHHGYGQPSSIHSLTSQTTPNDIIPSSVSAATSKLTLPLMPVITLNNNSVQLTGHWEMDAHAANKCFLHAPTPHYAKVPAIMVADQPIANTPPTRHHHPTHRSQKAMRTQSHTYPKGHSPPSSWSSRSGPAPGKVVKAKMNGRKVACHFCRRRRIACGVPPEGSTGNSCE